MNPFSEATLEAKTHHAGYSFHKYWSRKPHNVVQAALEACGVRKGVVVLDPFCGSGVPLSEAAALGATCFGIDVNPIALELSQVTLAPPSPSDFDKAFRTILEGIERRFEHAYDVNGRQLRYVVHATIVKCPGCGDEVASTEANRVGKKYLCLRCDTRLPFNLEHLIDTRQIKVVLDDGTSVDGEVAASEVRSPASDTKYDRAFERNPRVLAFAGMTTRSLFTNRNFEVLCAVADAIGSLPAHLRPAGRITLTAAVAQCSRLIAYRNDMKTGGPAWTVPGFWVPPVHLETNPLLHLRARLVRTVRGLKELATLPGRGAGHKLELGDAVRLVPKLAFPSPPSVVFFDPPYGDSVPFIEFSALWNSFLGLTPDPADDIAVSNRSRGDGTWRRYGQSMSAIVTCIGDVLAADGTVLVTFNNKDLRAWKALLGALQASRFRCSGAFYQHPAVVSAKAQFSPSGSYVGDIYATYTRSKELPNASLDPIRRTLGNALAALEGVRLDEGALTRIALTRFVTENVQVELIDDVPRVVKEALREY